MANSGGGAAIGLGAALLTKKHFKNKEIEEKKRKRVKRKTFQRTGGEKIPKLKSKQKKIYMSRGGKYDRQFALKVQLTQLGESPHLSIESVCDCSDYFREIHIVLATSERRNAAEKALTATYGSDYADYLEDISLLEENNVKLIIHTRSFDEGKLNVDVRRLIDGSALTGFKADQFEEWLRLRFSRSFGRKTSSNARYSLTCVVDEAVFTLWTPLIVTLMIFNWWRSFFSQLFRSKHGVDMNMYPIHHDESGPFIPDERKSLGCVPTTGFFIDRDPRLSIVDGPRTFLPVEWSGFERFMWLCQRQDRFGLGIIFGLPLFIWLFAFPYWNVLALLSPRLALLNVETFAPLRIGVLIIHSIFCVLALPTVYKGPFQNLVIVFAMPFVVMFFPVFLFYGMLFYKKEKTRGISANKVVEKEEEEEASRDNFTMITDILTTPSSQNSQNGQLEKKKI